MGEAKRRHERWTDSIPTQRVVVLEWLAPRESKTGSELVSRIASWGLAQPKIELRTCSSKTDVLDSIRMLASEVPEFGVPILHIEAHGRPGRDGGLTPSEHSSDLIRWTEFRRSLVPLNLATAFNLLVVGAACYGEGFVWSIGEEMAPAPFVNCVGFAREVGITSLRDILVEFYRGLLRYGENVEVAAARASASEAQDPAREYLRMTSVRQLLVRAIKAALNDEWSMHPATRMGHEVAVAVQASFKARGKTAGECYRAIHGSGDWSIRQACVHVVETILAIDRFPGNRKRFAIDVDQIIRDARREAGRP